MIWPIMRDWDQFLEQTPWFREPGDTAIVGEEQPWSRGEVAGLPHLSALLASATLTPVSISGTEYELLAWGPETDRRGWLCHPPLDADTGQVHPIHRDFWLVCGGIVERFRGPETWWLNQNQILTAAVVAVEANGNLTLVHRESGRLLLFAPDHAFTGVRPLPGCPQYSLLTLDDAPDLAAWIERSVFAQF